MFLGSISCALAETRAVDSELRSWIEEDWIAQEHRLGRPPGGIDAIQAALDRTERLLADLGDVLERSAREDAAQAFEKLRAEVETAKRRSAEERLGLYHRVRWFGRELALRNPAVAGKPIAFLKRHRFVCQMLHEYLGYFYDYGDVAGGGVYVLDRPGYSLAVRDLVGGGLPRGNYTTLALSYDARTLSWHETNEWHPFVLNDGRIVYTRWDYVDRSAANFHGLWASNPDGSNPVSQIEPGPDGSCPLSYPRLVQPVLDRHCVRCHDGSTGTDKSPLLLTGAPAAPFTTSYANLKPFLRWFEWGNASIGQASTPPGRIGADESPLTRVLDDDTHRPQASMPDEERRRLYLWLDANVPFYGTYSKEEQLAQFHGDAVPPPRLQ